MANNPYVNKVVLADGRTLIDLSSDTVTAAKMLDGTTAHDKSGATVTGTMMAVGSLYTTDWNVDPASILGFGTWEIIRISPFTYGEAKRFTHAQKKQDTYGHSLRKRIVYVWRRTA